jgi:hypothetical protein
LNLKRYCINNDIEYNIIVINGNAIKYYKNTQRPENYIEFLIKFISNLFESEVCVSFGLDKNRLDFPFLKMDISPKRSIVIKDNYRFESKQKIGYGLSAENYIVFHTKVRNDQSKNFSESRKIIKNFLQDFRTDYTILILGERSISENIESVTNDFHCIYDEILLLNNNNRVIDLTQSLLNDGSIVYSNFESDLNYISNAKLNVVFGIGGPLSLSTAFCYDNLIFVEKSTYSGYFNNLIKYVESDKNIIFTDIQLFLEKLQNLIGSCD